MKRIAGAAALTLGLAMLGFAPAWAQGEDLGMELPEAKREGFTEHRPQAKETASKLICFCGCERMTLDDCGCGFAYKELARIEELLSQAAERIARIEAVEKEAVVAGEIELEVVPHRVGCGRRRRGAASGSPPSEGSAAPGIFFASRTFLPLP